MQQHDDSASDDGGSTPRRSARVPAAPTAERTRRKVIDMFSAIGQWVYRHRRLVLVGWLVLFVVGIVVGSGVFNKLKDSNGAGSSESVQGARASSTMPAPRA